MLVLYQLSFLSLVPVPSLLLLPQAQVPRRPVPLTGALAADLPGALLRLPVLLHHALVLPPQLVIAPHSLAVLLHVREVRRPNQLHDVLEPCARLADGGGRAHPAVGAAGHPGPVGSRGPVLEWVREASVVAGQEVIHCLPLEDLEAETGQGLSETVLLGAADIRTFVLLEDSKEQEALICRYDPIIQLHLTRNHK